MERCPESTPSFFAITTSKCGGLQLRSSITGNIGVEVIAGMAAAIRVVIALLRVKNVAPA